MAVGYESSVINGQLVNVAPKQGFSPLTFGAVYTGPRWPAQTVYNTPPILPVQSGGGGGSGAVSDGAGGGVMGRETPTSAGISQDGSPNPFHPTKSPLWWAIGFLVVGLLMLHYVHYGRK